MLSVNIELQSQPAIFHGELATTEHRLRMIHDDSPESPREWDNLGTMYCEHRRYRLGDDKAEDIRVECERTGDIFLPKKGYTILPLYLYDHGGITMSTGAFSCPWDSGQVGYIYVSDERVRKEYGWKNITKKRREQIRNYLRGEVETYDQYLTGDVYGFEYQEVLVYPDGREEVIDEDSCWGFYGDDPATNGIADHLPVKLSECEVKKPW